MSLPLVLTIPGCMYFEYPSNVFCKVRCKKNQLYGSTGENRTAVCPFPEVYINKAKIMLIMSEEIYRHCYHWNVLHKAPN